MRYERKAWLAARMAAAESAARTAPKIVQAPSYKSDCLSQMEEFQWEDDGGFQCRVSAQLPVAAKVPEIHLEIVRAEEAGNDNAKDAALISGYYRPHIFTQEEVLQKMVVLRAQAAKKFNLPVSQIIDDEQLEAASKTVWRYGELRNKAGALLHNTQAIAPTGAGKTRYYGMVIWGLREIYPDLFPLNQLVLFCAPKGVIDSNQAAQEFLLFGNILLNTLIISLPSLRASLGDNFVEWKTVVVEGEPVQYPFWLPYNPPCLIIVDESQQVKNEGSDQSKVLESAAVAGIPILYGSATPYSRGSQAKIIACALRPIVTFGGNKKGIPLDVNIWASWIKDVCRPKDPTEWSPSALRRVQDWLEPHTIRFSCTYPHKLITKIAPCRFLTAEEVAIYSAAFQEWQRIREERGKNKLFGIIAELVALQKFNQIAEEIRVPHLVRAAIELYNQKEESGKLKASIILGFAFKTSLDLAYKEFLRCGIPAERVAVICGGQSDRPKNIERYKTDKAHFCLLTIASGGAGLDLGHNQRNKRQRYMFASAVWNDLQFVQLAGRAQRKNSRSTTYLYILAYEETEEISKLHKMLRKTRSLKEVTTAVRSSAMDDSPVSFIDATQQLEYDRSIITPADEEEEDSKAAEIVGTRGNIQFELEEDD